MQDAALRRENGQRAAEASAPAWDLRLSAVCGRMISAPTGKTGLGAGPRASRRLNTKH